MVQGFGNNLIGQNSVANFNKIFDSHLQAIDKNFNQSAVLAGSSEFENILNQKNAEAQLNMSMPLRTGIEINAGFANMPNLDLSASEIPSALPASEVERALGRFGESFADGVKSINAKQLEAENAVETLASGGDISVHEVMIAAEKASLSMQMGLQLRNKILNAYNELYNVRI